MLSNVPRINIRTQRRSGYLARCSYLTLTLAIGAAAIGCIVEPRAALAADWVGGNSTNWFDPGNWNPAAVPTAGDNTVISNGLARWTWVNGGVATANNVTVGQSANGLLQLSNGGTLTSTTGIIGDLAGSSGTVKMFDTGSSWTNSGNLTIGKNGAGELYLHSGNTVSNAAGIIGAFSGSSGVVIVDGPGATWTNSAMLTIGNDGTGRLTISDGGQVQSTYASIGAGNGSGTVDVTGAGSTWTNNGDLTVGIYHSGTLNILNGGAASNLAGYIGDAAGSTGSVKVDGLGSTWTNSDFLYVGSDGTGHLTISNGGKVQNTYGYVGAGNGGSGTVDVTGPGSTWTNNGDLYVGMTGTGVLNVLNGGGVSSGTSTIGGSAGSTGTVTVDGSGSTWINSSTLSVGNDGTGHLTISNGGKVQNTTAWIGAGVGSGAVDVTGVGSTWVNSGDLSVGLTGSGSLNILNGGAVSSGFGFVGDAFGSTGVAKVDGVGSTWTNTGDLIIGGTGSGALIVSNNGAVSNDTGWLGRSAGSVGTAIVDGAGSIWTNTALLTVGQDGNGALTISNNGVVSASGVQLAKNAGSTGTINIGAAAGAAASGAGKLNAATLQFGAGTGTLNFNHTDANYSFDTAMSGNGTINQLAGNTNLTADSSGFTGATNVQGGRLAVNGSLANSLVTVSGIGVLGGNGIVGGINAQAGGIIAPGNSIGTLNVNGNLNQAAGSIYQVELTSTGQSDLLHATGTATIANGALLRAVKLDTAPLVVGTHYTVLQADGGVTGAYTVLSPSTFIGFAASYDPTHVYLDVTQSKSFASVGLTRNQIATGAATEALAAGNAVYDAVLMSQTDDAARKAFDQLSGDIHASVKGVLLDDSRFPREAAINRLRSAFDSVGASLSPVMAYASSGPVSVAPDTDRFAVWGQGFGSWGRWRGDGNAAGLDRSTGGFIAGADGLAFDTWRVGLFGGYSRTNFDAKDRSSSGSSDNYHIGVYDGTQWSNLAIRSGLAYTWHDLSTNRNVAFPGFSDALKGKYNAGTAQAFGELGYSIKAGQVGFEPFANLAYVSLRTDSFTETGGAAALTSSRATSDATFTTLGLRASSNFTLGTVNTTVRGSLGWRHAFGDTTPLSALAFASGGSTFTIAGIPIAQDTVVTDVGLDFNVTRDTIFGISFDNQSGSGVTDQTIRANFSSKF